MRRKNIDGCATLYRPDLHRRPGRLTARLASLRSSRSSKGIQMFDDARSRQNGAGTAMRLTGMGRFARDHRAEYVDGLVRPNHSHSGRFSDDGEVRSREMGQCVIDHAVDAKAADFLVIRQRQVQRSAHRRRVQRREARKKHG